MRILVVTTFLSRADAIGEYVHALSGALADNGASVVVVCNRSEFPKDDRLQVREVYMRPSIVASTFSEHFDVIMAHVASADFFKFLTPIMKFNKGAKLVVDYHGITPINFVSRPTLKLSLIAERAIARMLARSADSIWVHSEYMRDEVERRFHAGKMTRVHPLYAREEFQMLDREACKRELGLESKTVLYVGRLERNKRVGMLVEALALLSGRSNERTTLAIVGEGSCKAEVVMKVASLHLEKNVRFVGRISPVELCKYYNAADVFATASMHEGFCIPIVESLACGTPVVGTNVSAIPSTMGGLGKTFELDDVEGLSRAIEGLLGRSEKECEEFRLRAKAHAERFSRPRVLGRMVDDLFELGSE